MSTLFAGLQITQLGVAQSLVGFLGVLQTSMGLLGVVDPHKAALAFGLPPGSPFATDNNLYIRVTGGTRLAGGIGMLLCLYLGENRALALNMLAGCMVGLIDAWSLRSEVARMKMTRDIKPPEVLESFEQAEGKAWGHAMAGPMALGLGAWLWSIS